MRKCQKYRKSIRLPEYDYSSSGMYFVTICTKQHRSVFGEIIRGEMRLNTYGRIIERQWHKISESFHCISLDKFIVMPNHLHGIIQINHITDDDCNTRSKNIVSPSFPTIGNIVGGFKSLCVNKCLQYINRNKINIFFGKLWQRNYYEHVIRNENSLHEIRKYILENPLKWELDHYNPNNIRNKL